MPGSPRAFAIALTLTSLVMGGVSAAPASATTASASPATSASALPLPACRYLDKSTRFDKVRHWRKTLLDTNLRVARGYVPSDLVPVSRAGIGGSARVRKVIVEDLREMASAARLAGKPIAVRSAYRSYDTQVATFNFWVKQSGYQRALKAAARPGHSEHQMGTTLDFMSARSSKAPWAYPDFGRTPAGKWLIRNSWKYGFVLSYPKGMQRVSCYVYEPWHYRYMGRDRARQIHGSGQVPRRYLWETFESAP